MTTGAVLCSGDANSYALLWHSLLAMADMSAKTLIAFTVASYDGFLVVGVCGVAGVVGVRSVLGVVVGALSFVNVVVVLGLGCVVVCAVALFF